MCREEERVGEEMRIRDVRRIADSAGHGAARPSLRATWNVCRIADSAGHGEAIPSLRATWKRPKGGGESRRRHWVAWDEAWVGLAQNS